MQTYYDLILETLEDPDLIPEGDEVNEFVAVRPYTMISESRKYVMVVYREVDNYNGFIKTAYLRYSPSTRKRILWIL